MHAYGKYCWSAAVSSRSVKGTGYGWWIFVSIYRRFGLGEVFESTLVIGAEFEYVGRKSRLESETRQLLRGTIRFFGVVALIAAKPFGKCLDLSVTHLLLVHIPWLARSLDVFDLKRFHALWTYKVQCPHPQLPASARRCTHHTRDVLASLRRYQF